VFEGDAFQFREELVENGYGYGNGYDNGYDNGYGNAYGNAYGYAYSNEYDRHYPPRHQTLNHWGEYVDSPASNEYTMPGWYSDTVAPHYNHIQGYYQAVRFVHQGLFSLLNPGCNLESLLTKLQDHDFSEMPAFDEQIQMENVPFTDTTVGMASQAEGFRLRAEAPEFIPGKHVENQEESK
jgi:hypothetical protein